MEDTGDCPQLQVVLRALQEFFVKVEQTDTRWTELIKTSTPTVKSIMNLVTQLDCVNTADLQCSPLMSFPDIQGMVRYKIKVELEEEMASLQQSLEMLRRLRNTAQKEAERARSTYLKNSVSLNVSLLIEATPTRPSLADMLAWVDDVEMYFKEEYLQRNIIIKTLDYGNAQTCKELVKIWSSVPDRRHLTWILANTQFFIKDSIDLKKRGYCVNPVDPSHDSKNVSFEK